MKYLHPDGISLSLSSKTQQRLFVVNHRKVSDTVEIFAYNKHLNTLVHEKSVKDKLFENLVDVAAVNEKMFFATSHTFYSNPILRGIERYLALPYGKILFFNGKEVVEVEKRIATPAGITLDNIRRVLYVASLSSESIAVYRVIADFQLMKLKDIPLQTSPHFIWADIDNSIIAVCHPVKMRYFYYEVNPSTQFSPSQVLKIHAKPFSNKTTKIDQLYANDGASVSGARSAIRNGDTLLLGGERSPLVSCEIQMKYKERRRKR